MFRDMDAFEWFMMSLMILLVASLLSLLGLGIYSEITKPNSGIIYDMAEIEPHYEGHLQTTYVYNGNNMTPIISTNRIIKERTWVLFIKNNETGRTNRVKVSKEKFDRYKIGDFYE